MVNNYVCKRIIRNIRDEKEKRGVEAKKGNERGTENGREMIGENREK